MGAEFAFALMFLGLSYHLTNALRYLKRERLGEALLWLVVIFVLITHFDLILL
jgi:dipeptide/tripeptide permease